MNKRTLIIAAIVLAFAGGAQAATLTVTNTSDGPALAPRLAVAFQKRGTARTHSSLPP